VPQVRKDAFFFSFPKRKDTPVGLETIIYLPLRNYFRYIKLLLYSTKWQIYDKIFCSFFVFLILSIAGSRSRPFLGW